MSDRDNTPRTCVSAGCVKCGTNDAAMLLLSASVADLNVKLHALGGDEAFVAKLRDERVRELEAMCAGSERRCATAEFRAEATEAALAKAENRADGLEMALDAEKHNATKSCEFLLDRAEAAEAKLAKAREALEEICSEPERPFNCHTCGVLVGIRGEHDRRCPVAVGRAALATIRAGDFELPKTLAGIAYKENP